MCKSDYPTQEELEECFELRVDFRNGHETLWRKFLSTNQFGNKGEWVKVECKANHNKGYCQVGFKGRMVLYHTIIWILTFGDIQEGLVILHKDSHSKLYNQSEDLRIGPQRKNCQELQIHIDGKLCGCTYIKHAKKWKAQIVINYKNINIGLFNTEEDANKAYNQALIMMEEGATIEQIKKAFDIKTKDTCTSIYKGICWHKGLNKWQVYISIDKKRICLGYFLTELEAHTTYCRALELIDKFVDGNQFRLLLKRGVL